MKTAVEWLEDKVYNIINDYDGQALSFYIQEAFEQAKEMENQQIIDARVSAPLLNTGDKLEYVKEAEQYYNETFEK
jgi:hypothetical protein